MKSIVTFYNLSRIVKSKGAIYLVFVSFARIFYRLPNTSIIKVSMSISLIFVNDASYSATITRYLRYEVVEEPEKI